MESHISAAHEFSLQESFKTYFKLNKCCLCDFSDEDEFKRKYHLFLHHRNEIVERIKQNNRRKVRRKVQDKININKANDKLNQIQLDVATDDNHNHTHQDDNHTQHPGKIINRTIIKLKLAQECI